MKTECPNFLRKQKHPYISLWSVEESVKEEEFNEVGIVTLVFVADEGEATPMRTVVWNSSDNETEMAEETIIDQYQALYFKWTKDIETISRLKRKNLSWVRE